MNLVDCLGFPVTERHPLEIENNYSNFMQRKHSTLDFIWLVIHCGWEKWGWQTFSGVRLGIISNIITTHPREFSILRTVPLTSH
jgi:hypothetical protein